MADATPLSPSFLPTPAAVGRPLPRLLVLSLRRPGSRRAVSALTVVLFLAGLSMFAFPALTDLIGTDRQRHVTAQFSDPQFTTVYKAHHVPVGQGLTRLVIDNPRLSVDVLVVEGTTVAALRAGAGHYPKTPYPCEQGNVGIAGHRTTYGRPFNRIDQMQPGDTVTLITPLARCTYRAVPAFGGHGNPFIVAPTDVGVVSQAGQLGSGHWLTLTSCNPKGSAAQRIVLRAVLVSTQHLTPHTTQRGNG